MFKPLLANPPALTQSSSTSSSSGVENQEQHRHTLIAFDLHGHGASPDATDTESTYTFAGYASSAAQALQHLGITDVLNYGCSLGGHVAKDLAMQLAEPGSHSHSHSSTDGRTKVRGLMISSSPPCHNLAEALEGFNMDPADNLAGTPQPFTDAEPDALVRQGYGAAQYEEESHPWMRAAARRADPRARAATVASVLTGGSGGRGGTRDHRAFLRTPGGVPVAVVNGVADVFCKLDVFDTLD